MSTHLLELTGKLINYVHKCRIGHREHNDGATNQPTSVEFK